MNSISQINSSSAVALSITALLHATVIYSLLNQNFDSPIKEVEPKTVQVKFVQLPKTTVSSPQVEHAQPEPKVTQPLATPVQPLPPQQAEPVKTNQTSKPQPQNKPSPSNLDKAVVKKTSTNDSASIISSTAEEPKNITPTPIQSDVSTNTATPVNKPAATEKVKTPPTFDEKNYKPISKLKPDYPMRALENELEGNCTIEYSVNTQGHVINPKALSDCDPVFIRPSLNAARQFKYQPHIVNGQAVEVPKIRNTFEYRIE
ncbi:energy transducer TonB [Acinetobacter lwoffii]|uniref:Protein TonB n=1 Tax=Acinetobacter lwoffii NCTC 5866 = CIP 64.10 = NIPH 512 TaxID=981327 RepID=A0ABP2ZD73_ACILW|nr:MULTISPECIES: energy transducer TonB [Acinetobacter]ENU16011.1 hypothetical protein F995_01477 [Acinetobacter sp. CIP A162]ESJ95372.1 hypothetical protein P800_00176 [Acinetobacter lwoffii NCTC 5866 = CIP 64.10 = NIPH 512]MCO8071284.1 energy transducer TonB [Acinetobacter lwoffii]MCO8093316.1 energy transducer TonB [Acinetobacter lwoffii]MDM1753419.1 energy transducer TonB [Acinetobacter towneri]